MGEDLEEYFVWEFSHHAAKMAAASNWSRSLAFVFASDQIWHDAYREKCWILLWATALADRKAENGPLFEFLITELSEQRRRAGPKRASPREGPKIDPNETVSAS